MDTALRAQRVAAQLIEAHSFRAIACNVSFFMRKGSYPEKTKSGVLPKKRSPCIQVRLTIRGVRSGVRSTGIKVEHPDQFNTQTLLIQGDPINTQRLLSLKSDILRIFNERQLMNKSLSPNHIIDIAFGVSGHDEEAHYVMGSRVKTGQRVYNFAAVKPQTQSVIEGLAQYLDQKEKLLGNGLVKASVERYREYVRKLSGFVQQQYGADWPIHFLTPAVEYDLFAYLKGQQGLTHNYACKIIQFFKSFLTYAHAHGWVDRNVMATVRLRKERKEVRTLSLLELEQVANCSLESVSLARIRDVFLFCCYTGLAWTDVRSLGPQHIVEVEGADCIILDRNKSGQQAFIPLFAEAIGILDKYADYHSLHRKGVLLPVCANQSMNEGLKLIAQRAGVSLKLTTHIGRKSFTAFAESRGFGLDEMAVMLGHSHATMTERHYHQRRREPVMKVFRQIHSDGLIKRLAS